MNPTLPATTWPAWSRTTPRRTGPKYLGEFRVGIRDLARPDALEACVADGVRERPHETGRRYVSFVDAASGSGKDAFTVAIAHADGQRAVLDVVAARGPPVQPERRDRRGVRAA
jgi:hypothetical protein